MLMVTSGSAWFARCMNSAGNRGLGFGLVYRPMLCPLSSLRLRLVRTMLKFASLSFAVALNSTTTVEFPVNVGGEGTTGIMPELQPETHPRQTRTQQTGMGKERLK